MGSQEQEQNKRRVLEVLVAGGSCSYAPLGGGTFLFDEKGKGVSESVIDIDVFPKQYDTPTNVFATTSKKNIAATLVTDLCISQACSLPLPPGAAPAAEARRAVPQAREA